MGKRMSTNNATSSVEVKKFGDQNKRPVFSPKPSLSSENQASRRNMISEVPKSPNNLQDVDNATTVKSSSQTILQNPAVNTVWATSTTMDLRLKVKLKQEIEIDNVEIYAAK